jgi:arylformamidase
VSRLIDISMPVSSGTPAWPGSPGARTRQLKSLAEGDEANASLVEMDVHTGTHLDAPSHMLRDGQTIEQYDLEVGMGAATVADTGAADAIDAEALASLGLPDDCRRLLLRTQNSRRPELRHRFSPDYAALTLSGAEWVVEHGLALVGIDYLSIQLFDDPTETHHVLFRAGITILEGLRLETVQPGAYELLCLPLLLSEAEAAPTRAVLKCAT